MIRREWRKKPYFNQSRKLRISAAFSNLLQTREGIQQHLRTEHDWRSPQRKGRRSVAAKLAKTVYPRVVTSPVYCQTFYHQSEFIRFFQVAYPSFSTAAATAAPAIKQEQSSKLAVSEPSTSLPEQVILQLDQKLYALCERAQAEGLGTRHATQVDPWLDKTLWEQYLHSQDLATAARLIDLPL